MVVAAFIPIPARIGMGDMIRIGHEEELDLLEVLHIAS